MLTPQQVAKHAFGKSSFSGYNMAAVDDFLDEVTRDYETLYSDNALLKQKLGLLSDKIKEYQSTEGAMRKTLLAAQTMADQMVAEAKSKRDELVRTAEADAAARVEELRSAVETEQLRLTAARNATTAYVHQLKRLCEDQVNYLAHLDQVVPPQPSHVDRAVSDIEAALRERAEKAAPTPAAVESHAEVSAEEFQPELRQEFEETLPESPAVETFGADISDDEFAPAAGLYGELVAHRDEVSSQESEQAAEKPTDSPEPPVRPIISAPFDIEIPHRSAPTAPEEPRIYPWSSPAHQEPRQEPRQEPQPDPDLDATRRISRFDDLDKNFGRDYEA